MSKVSGFDEFRKALEGMEVDYQKAQKDVVRDMAYVARGVAIENTPVGNYDGPVSFTTEEGKDVSFMPKTKRVGGTLRRNWQVSRTQVKGGKVTKELFNNTNYAVFVNNGHRVVNKNGETVKWLEGVFMLEKGIEVAERALPFLFDREIGKAAKKRGF